MALKSGSDYDISCSMLCGHFRCLARRAAVALVVLTMGAGCALAQGNPLPAPPPPNPLPRVAGRIAEGVDLRITAFGSSSTEGAGASSKAASYPSRLERVLSARLSGRVAVLNRGIGGEDADDMARRLPAILAEQPDLVIWQTGTNDPLRAVPVERFVAETRAGIADMRAAGVDVMLIEPQFCEIARAPRHAIHPAFTRRAATHAHKTRTGVRDDRVILPTGQVRAAEIIRLALEIQADRAAHRVVPQQATDRLVLRLGGDCEARAQFASSSGPCHDSSPSG